MEGKDLETNSLDHFDEDLSSTDYSTHRDANVEVPVPIAASETRWVKRSKFLVFFVLIAATTACAYATYSYTSHREEADFSSQFEVYGHQILDVSHVTAENVFETIKSMSTTITSYTMSTNATWPFVTIPHYAARGSQLLQLSGSWYLALSPLVREEQRGEWETYALENQGWLKEDFDGSTKDVELPSVSPFIWRWDRTTFTPIREEDGSAYPYCPYWQIVPGDPSFVNQNVFSVPGFTQVYNTMIKEDTIVLSQISNLDNPVSDNPFLWPQSYISAPVHETLEKGSKLVAVYSAVLPWHKYFLNAIPNGVGRFYVVVKTICPQGDLEAFTYLVNQQEAEYLGPEDLHDRKYTHMELSADFDVLDTGITTEACQYSIHVFPSDEFHDNYTSKTPVYDTIAIVVIFVLTSSVFVLYDCFVKRKDDKLMFSAVSSNAIVSSLFPAHMRARLIEDAVQRRKAADGGKAKNAQTKDAFKTLEDVKAGLLKTKPIADLFPNVTVMFADIAGFSAWASVREPSQVFTLLEQIYGSFDIIAKRRGVFKVETIGDCYVAASGLPEPRADHAVVMTRFARDCLNDMNQSTLDLELLLGPDTSELSMRFGLHSGPVTAGVLRGEKSRFQLFGDTVNTASRMESTGTRNRIHLSQDTANCLIEQGRKQWLKPREDLVFIKGKGNMQTYWVDFSKSGSIGAESASAYASLLKSSEFLSKTSHKSGKSKMKFERLINWNVDSLLRLLKNVVAMRDANNSNTCSPKNKASANKRSEQLKIESSEDRTVLDEVKEIIQLPGKAAKYKQDPESIELDPEVVSQLAEFVATIASMYRDNPFHNFEHASHVSQSVMKLLARVVTPESIDYNDMSYVKKQGTAQLHEYTYGITSDPLTQFACAFSALIHDVDHTGVPNVTLIKENAEIADKYRSKSVAEQNSVDLAWSLLEQENFAELRKAIYATEAELLRFRQLVVNSVMATDIVDKELGALRKKRWNKAFNLDDDSVMSEATQDDVNRKATIVIEHMIQASDVSHTMQHWHVYLKWNERLFQEMYKAYLEGRAEKDPSEGWYQGELGFFDFYLIPLGKKLKDCDVFGVASDEYLNYAVANRREWERLGKEVVAGYLAKFEGHIEKRRSSTGVLS